MDHYHHLNTKGRESILFMLGEGRSLRTIAAALGRRASTISRERKRNQIKKGYSPAEAEKGILGEEKSAVGKAPLESRCKGACKKANSLQSKFQIGSKKKATRFR